MIVLQLTGTLGYPGEGPKRLKRLKMAAFNVRGVKGKDDRIYLHGNRPRWREYLYLIAHQVD